MKSIFKKNVFREYLYLGLIIVLTIILGFFNLDKKSFWFDETYTVFVTQKTTFMLNILWNHEANMWLYYILIHFWQMVSIGELWIRSFSVLFAALSIGLFYLLTKKIFDSVVARIATLLLAFNFLFIFNAQNARSYSLLLFLTLLSSILFWRFIYNNTFKNKLFFSLVSALAIYTHVYAGFLLIGQLMYFYLEKKNDAIKTIFWIGLVQGTLLLPFVSSPAFWGDQVGWLDAPSIYAPFGIFSLFAGDFIPTTIIFGLLSLWVFYLGLRNLSQKAIKYCLLLLTIPVFISLGISFLIKPIYQSIYLFVSLPYFLMLISWGISQISSRIIRTMIVFSILFFSSIRLYGWFWEVPNLNFLIENQKEEWRELTEDIVNLSKPKDGMLFFPYNVDVSVEAYLRNYPEITLDDIQLTNEYYSLGGNTKILPFPDKDRLEYALKYDRLWFIEADVDTHKELNTLQKGAIMKFIDEYYIPIDHKEYFDVRWNLYQKK